MPRIIFVISTLLILHGCSEGGSSEFPGDSAAADTATVEELSTDSEPNSCDGVSCFEPPANACVDSLNLQAFNSLGWCEAGQCQYGSTESACDPGTCDNGVCTSSPCQGVSCATPEAPTCADAASMYVDSPIGYCAAQGAQSSCTYSKTRVDCADQCLADECVGEPCAGVVCNMPPARYCSGDDLVVFDVFGRCDAGGCLYDSQVVDCGTAGCEDGHCSGSNLCQGLTCIVPPASYCKDATTLRTYVTPGACEGGECFYNNSDLLCSGGCLGGRCEGDPCAGVACVFPPAARCKNADTLLSWDGEQGTCTDGACAYATIETDCPSGCANGACQGNTCLGVSCEHPPAAYCDGNELVAYQAPGHCDNGFCEYTEARSTCLNSCQFGACTEVQASLAISLEANKTAGYGPLYVFFDASGTTSTATTRPFHHLNYSWDFDDPGSRRPTASGPVAAHVFENPGTYTVSLTVSDRYGREASVTEAITVTDQDAAFSGTSTLCVASDTDFDGCPSGASTATTTALDVAFGLLTPNKRLLFKRGDTFSATHTVYHTVSNYVIGAFGTGTNPDQRGLFDNAPVLELDPTDGDDLLLSMVGHDYIVQDVSVNVVGAAADCLESKNQNTNALFYRLKTDNCREAIAMSHVWVANRSEPRRHDLAVVDCSILNSTGSGVLVGGDRIAFLGNKVHFSALGNNIECDFARGMVIVDNDLGYNLGDNRSLIHLHAKQDKTLHGDYSEQFVVTDNILRDPNNAWVVSLGAGDPALNEGVKDVVFERNYLHSTVANFAAVAVMGKQISLRNNVQVVDSFVSNPHAFARIFPKVAGAPVPEGVEIYHNTLYSGAVEINVHLNLVTLEQHTGEVLIMNNLLWAPLVTNNFIVAGTASYSASNNQIDLDPLFVDPATNNFSLQVGSPAINAGTALPVMEDYLRSSRLQDTPDVGAYEFQ